VLSALILSRVFYEASREPRLATTPTSRSRRSQIAPWGTSSESLLNDPSRNQLGLAEDRDASPARQTRHICSRTGGVQRFAAVVRFRRALPGPLMHLLSWNEERRRHLPDPGRLLWVVAAVSTNRIGPSDTAGLERFRQSAGRGCPTSAGLLLPFQMSSQGTPTRAVRDCCLWAKQ
jgi:hypothetical protein